MRRGATRRKMLRAVLPGLAGCGQEDTRSCDLHTAGFGPGYESRTDRARARARARARSRPHGRSCRTQAFFCGLLVALAWMAWAAWWSALRGEVGEPSALVDDTWHVGHRIVDRHGVLLRELPAEGGHRGRQLSLEEVGDRLVQATLVAEDGDFFEHDGVSRRAILRAIEQNLRHGRVVSGASTVTQQLVKLLDGRGEPTGPRTLEVKLREAARAQNLERVLAKDDILGAYLDRLPYGHGLVGPEAAAMGYFGVHSRDLSWAQAAFLAVLPRAPSYLDPYAHLERVLVRQRLVLEGLHARGILGSAELDRATKEPIELRPLRRPFAAPHLMQTMIAEGRLATGEVTTTTIDAALQRDVEGLVRTHVSKMVERGASDAAVIVLDNATGDVLAYVGSTDFHDPDIAGQVDMVRARRQPGSSLKPFVYALAFESGTTGAQMLADVPTELALVRGETWTPRNFHGDFVGPISAREALAASLNIPVVHLAEQVGPDALLERLRALGLDSLDRDADHYGLSLALGSGEVELRALAGAYVALARGGQWIPLRYRTDAPPASPREVIDPSAAAAVTEALADPRARVRLLDGRSPFDIGYPLALKTGTSSGFRDAWTVGFTHERTVAVWLGNADGTAMRGVTGAGGAGPLFADVMRRTMLDVPTRDPLWDPESLVSARVCPLSGKAPGPACPDAVHRRFMPDHRPDAPCDVHVHAVQQGDRWICTDDDAARTPIVVLPAAFDEWLAGLSTAAPGKDPYGLPWISAEHAPSCSPQSAGRPSLRITTPVDGQVFWRDPADPTHDVVPLRARIEGSGEATPHIEMVEFVVDGEVVGESRAPFEALVRLPPGDHEVLARPTDPHATIPMQSARFSVR
jgi:penicillin-binding protein 1C